MQQVLACFGTSSISYGPTSVNISATVELNVLYLVVTLVAEHISQLCSSSCKGIHENMEIMILASPLLSHLFVSLSQSKLHASSSAAKNMEEIFFVSELLQATVTSCLSQLTTFSSKSNFDNVLADTKNGKGFVRNFRHRTQFLHQIPAIKSSRQVLETPPPVHALLSIQPDTIIPLVNTLSDLSLPVECKNICDRIARQLQIYSSHRHSSNRSLSLLDAFSTMIISLTVFRRNILHLASAPDDEETNGSDEPWIRTLQAARDKDLVVFCGHLNSLEGNQSEDVIRLRHRAEEVSAEEAARLVGEVLGAPAPEGGNIALASLQGHIDKFIFVHLQQPPLSETNLSSKEAKPIERQKQQSNLLTQNENLRSDLCVLSLEAASTHRTLLALVHLWNVVLQKRANDGESAQPNDITAYESQAKQLLTNESNKIISDTLRNQARE